MIGIVMGSKSDWATMGYAANMLADFGVNYEVEIVSAHRTPDKLFSYAEKARGRNISLIIAGAGGAAHLPGMLAAKTSVPILAVPMQSKVLNGVDSLLSIVQMPQGVPVATFSIGADGAVNAALYAIAVLAIHNSDIADKLNKYRLKQADMVNQQSDELYELCKQ